MSTADDITRECAAIRDLLLAKNLAYGDSALDPVRIFSQADPVEQILVRIDDKLSRLGRGKAAGEDVEQDLLGYLVLLRIAKSRAANTPPAAISPVFTLRATERRACAHRADGDASACDHCCMFG